MINIEQELEISGNSYVPAEYTVLNARHDGDDHIIVDIGRKDRNDGTTPYYHDWYFWAKTGVFVGHEAMDDPLRLRPRSAQQPITRYFLFAGRPDWGKEGWAKLATEVFLNGKDAAERMKYHNGLFTSSMSPFRTMVKPETELSDVCDYPSWAEFRFSSGEWGRLPWEDEPWFTEHVPSHHHAHLSVADNCMVAFWESELSAQRDTVTVMAPGRYLQRYFAEHLNSTQIRDWAVQVDVECELKFAHTPDEIETIYTTRGAPQSCMSAPADDYDGSIHPVRVYGAGDLALAYLERKGKIVARALVWPDKKVAGRRYGDIERLTDKLRAEGYTMDSDDSSAEGRGSGGFDGARLLRVDEDGALIMPYLDAGYGVSYLARDNPDRTKYVVMKRRGFDISCTNTNGFSSDHCEDDYDYYCDDCGEGLYSDDAYHVENSTYCHYHMNERSVECHRCDELFHRSNTYIVDDERYCSACYEEHTYTCDYCSARTCSTTPVHDARSAPDTVEGEACQTCLDDNEEIQVDHNGHWINTENATLCDTCSEWRSNELESCPSQSCQQTAANQNQEVEIAA